jgi:hypothetical protein
MIYYLVLGYLGSIYQWRFLMWKQVMTQIWDYGCWQKLHYSIQKNELFDKKENFLIPHGNYLGNYRHVENIGKSS